MSGTPHRKDWLRRLALLALVLLLLRVAARALGIHGSRAVDTGLPVAAFLTLALVAFGYLGRWLAWSWRKLLWRVRSRLVITYLFVGLTPILLMAAHSMISAFGLSMEAMARIIIVQLGSAVDQSEAFARSLVAELELLPADASAETLRAALAERAGLVRTVLPGARLELVEDAALPAWLAGRRSWSGITHTGDQGAGAEDGLHGPDPAMAIRALARGGPPERPLTVLLEVPLDQEFAFHLSGMTGMRILPAASRQRDAAPAGWFYVAMMPSTEWTTGIRSQRVTMTFDWSWAEAGRQVLGSSPAGRYWRLGLILVGFAFLALEMIALGTAAWMVRAVTHTVDRLHRATAFIGRGDFSHRISVRSRDQLGELARHFNDMSARIEDLLRGRVERERLEREVVIAAQVQARLFPRTTPHLATVEVAGECRAARGVAGDYFDYVEVAPGLVAFALGDVAGKGISASLLMSNLQASLRAQASIAGDALRGGDGPQPVAGLTGRLNRQLFGSIEDNRYATLFLGFYDDSTRRMRYTNAGHNPPILLRPGGGTSRLTDGGTVLGAFAESRYGEGEAHLESEGLLLLYSDGLTEAVNAAGEEFGEQRITDLAQRHRHLSADDLRRTIFSAIDAWSGAQERADDQTLLIVKGLAA
jgi:phosphoserine phosphatase RsbU/P